MTGDPELFEELQESCDGFYGKCFESMYEGSMWGKSLAVYAVWGYVIAKQRRRINRMYVELNPQKLAPMFSTTPDVILEAIRDLCTPDLRSRSTVEQGRRLVPVNQNVEHDGPRTFWVVNGFYYRRKRDKEERQEQNRQASARYRQKVQNSQPASARVSQRHPESAHPEPYPNPNPNPEESRSEDASAPADEPEFEDDEELCTEQNPIDADECTESNSDEGRVYGNTSAAADDDFEKRRARAAAKGAQVIDQTRAGVLRKRTKQLEQAQAKERGVKNLNSRGPRTVNTRTVAAVWMETIRSKFPNRRFAPWAAKEFGQAKRLIDDYGSAEIVVDAVRYMLNRWDTIRARGGKCPVIPTIGWLLACHASLVPESQAYSQYAPLLVEYEDAWKTNPTKGPPGELRKRYEQAKPEMQRLGLVS